MKVRLKIQLLDKMESKVSFLALTLPVDIGGCRRPIVNYSQYYKKVVLNFSRSVFFSYSDVQPNSNN
jgi:hypothetical protein